jgi:hypothetical protein
MTMERSSTIMDAIFSSPEEESRGRLLKIMQEFLTSEASKHSAKEKGSSFSFGRLYWMLICSRECEGKSKAIGYQHG